MRVIRWLDENGEKYICVALFMVFTAVMIVNVFMRYVLKQAIPWASDLVLFIFVWFVWFGISYGFKSGAHVNVTAVTGLFPARAQEWLALFCSAVTFLGFCYILYFGIVLLLDPSVLGKYGLLVKYPMWSLYLSTPVGAGCSLIRIGQNMAGQIREFRKKEE